MTSLKDLFDSSYLVYKLINHSKEEIYYGITNDFDSRIDKHKNNDVVATKRWVFGKDDIDKKIIDTDLTKPKASDKAHEHSNGNLSDLLKYSSYEVIKTGGW
ncbi:GIY-YIG nuclease family protein [Fodinibius halophilus]|uniref:GIY-YIG nuclease family protein n=1 Tax=Fodinibius halophilus TaxID=1736908 RepID=A0A6M1TB55_9BACT|nr:GIY-YIG nuclease family protein [Fodinibius halophilus]NGP87562.1 GIY-YIG nuclease family protein [Fodinibius halophilus]